MTRWEKAKAKLKVAWTLVKDALSDFFARFTGRRSVPESSLTYEEWKIGRYTYYDMVDLVKPRADKNFSTDALRERYRQLSRIFSGHGENANRIIADINEAYDCLIDDHERLVYNLRLDLRERRDNWFQLPQIILLLIVIYLI